MARRARCPLEEGYRALSAHPLLGAERPVQTLSAANFVYVGFGDPDDAGLYYAPAPPQDTPVGFGGGEALGEHEQQQQSDTEDSPRALLPAQCTPGTPSGSRTFDRGPRPECFGRRPPPIEIGEDSPPASPASTRPPSPAWRPREGPWAAQIDWGDESSGEHGSPGAYLSSQEVQVAAAARGAHRRQREACPRVNARARACFGDELLDIDTVIQLLLLDTDMRAVRLLRANPRERQVLQDLAQCYRFTVHCVGRGKSRLVILKKNKNSGAGVNSARLRGLLGKDNQLRRPDCEPPAAAPVRAVYRDKSRMTRLPPGYASRSECRALEAAT
eukprot:TRINITY_DN884_c1_g2_i3.p2 TRINITY_DN884_c1_g2~~TRINITY_DN884_c1_g2_i3.p2  ORF type:complete len:363 (+),score=108.08 TRINITY_DN884_c1_g2_i3:100-1089(+)